MRISREKLEIILASQCKTMTNLQPGISAATGRKIKAGHDVRPDVVGRVARALDVNVQDILETED